MHRHPLRLAAAAAGLLLFASCAPDLYVSRIVPLAPDCAVLSPSRPDDDLAAGMLNVAPGFPQFFAGVELVRQPRKVLADGTYAPPGPNDGSSGRVVITSLTMSYQSTPVLAGLRTAKRAVAVELDSGWGAATIPVQLIGDDAGLVLQTTSAGDSITLKVSVTAEGYSGSAGGAQGAFTTTPLVFPITVYRSAGLDCGSRGYVQHTGACQFAGQSVAPATTAVECCPAAGCP